MEGFVITRNSDKKGFSGYTRIPASCRITGIKFKIRSCREKGDIPGKSVGLIIADSPICVITRFFCRSGNVEIQLRSAIVLHSPSDPDAGTAGVLFNNNKPWEKSLTPLTKPA